MRTIAFFCMCMLLVTAEFIIPRQEEPTVYESEWAVKLEDGVAPSVLEELGYSVVGPVGNLKNIYVVKHHETLARHQVSHSNKLVASPEVTASLLAHPSVQWAEQQFVLPHEKKAMPADPLVGEQWHLKNTGQFAGLVGVDANVEGAWDLGLTGQGVRIAVVDDGYQTTHPDLAARYQAASSFNFNNPQGSSPDPNVAADFHGTAAAGVALAADNGVCGVGSAYRAEGAGIRLLGGPASDATVASALSYKNQDNHIYSNSWGFRDDIPGVVAAGPLTVQALADNVKNGRGGKGNIYVWAAGNGLEKDNNCNYDGYANSVNVISVGAIGNNGKQSYYSEPCASMLITAPSNSANANAGIRTSDIVGANGYSTTDCTPSFGGTSSACPLVSGIVALMLEANSDLSYRDVAVILAKTAVKTDPDDTDWTNNAAGLHVNHKYGFGRVDATAAVKLAKSWTNIPPLITATSGTKSIGLTIPDNNPTGVSATVTIPDDFVVERVVITTTINHPTGGDLAISVFSPSGTESVLSTPHEDAVAVTQGNTAFLAGAAAFGPEPTFTGTPGNALRSNPTIACTTPITNCAQLAGTIALVARGTCDFAVKVKNVQNCGAIGAIIINNDAANPDVPIFLAGTDATITIPTVSVSLNAGAAIANGNAVSITKIKNRVNSYGAGWGFTSVRYMGERSAGTWTVKVVDAFAGTAGTFTSLKLDVYGTSSLNSGAYSLVPASLVVYLVLAAVMATLTIVL